MKFSCFALFALALLLPIKVANAMDFAKLDEALIAYGDLGARVIAHRLVEPITDTRSRLDPLTMAVLNVYEKPLALHRFLVLAIAKGNRIAAMTSHTVEGCVSNAPPTGIERFFCIEAVIRRYQHLESPELERELAWAKTLNSFANPYFGPATRPLRAAPAQSL